MNKNELFTSLNELCRELDDKYSINSGGCCLIAAYLAEFLEKANIPFTVINYNKYGCHFAIRVEDRIINRCDYSYTEIIYDKFMSSKEHYDLYKEELDLGYWNNAYERKYNSTIKRKIKALFNKYGNSIRRRSTYSSS